MFNCKKKDGDVVPILDAADLSVRIYRLEGAIDMLKNRIKQIECAHDFVFTDCVQHMLLPPISAEEQSNKYIHVKCSYCGVRKSVGWSRLLMKQRQAYHDLKLVPSDWPVHVKKENK